MTEQQTTRGFRIGDKVRDEAGRRGRVTGIVNGHAEVKFTDATHRTVFIGATQDHLSHEGDAPVTVASRDARFDPLKGAEAMAADVRGGDVVAVALVGITSTGAVRLYASESTGQTLNMLAQGIKLADGTLLIED